MIIEMDKDLILFKGRRPQCFVKMEDDLNYLVKWKTITVLRMVDELPTLLPNFSPNPSSAFLLERF